MMHKLFFIACLCACVFGATRFFTKSPSCAYHFKVSQTDFDGDYYGMIIGYSVMITKNISADGSYDLIRCDIRNDKSRCYATFYRPNDQDKCEHDWVDVSEANDRFVYDDNIRFYYDEKKYPEPVKCADGTDGCQKYCRMDRGENCVIVDANGFTVQANGVNYAWLDSSFDLDIFKEDNQCNDPQYSAPHNFCETVKTINPVLPDCSYHLKVQDPFATKEFFGVHVTPGYSHTVYSRRIVGETRVLSRRDISVGDSFYCKVVEDGQCTEDPGTLYDPDWPSSFRYDSASYPKDVKCPDDSNGCKLYCLDSTGTECAIFDYLGRLVKRDDEVWTYYSEPPMSVFEDDTCEDPKQHLPAPVNICETRKVFNPKFDCTFHMALDLLDRRRKTVHFDLYGVIDDDKIVAFKFAMGEYFSVARLDVTNDKGEYYVYSYSLDDCNEQYMDYHSIEKEMLEYLPESFWYDSSNYPVDTKCPDGSDGCKKYCLVSSSCIITDAADNILKTAYGNNYTYYPAPSLDEFAVDTCNGKHIPAPTACNGGQSSTPEPPKPSTSATSAPVSSASVVKSAFTFVAILIVVALL